jgi:predicted O-methyltransferase YrrM
LDVPLRNDYYAIAAGDNHGIALVPEPASLALLALGGLASPVASEAKYRFSADWVNKGGRVEDWTRALMRYRHLPRAHGLEIGSFEGRSAIWFLDNILTDDSSKLTCVDLFAEEYESVFDANIEASGHSRRVEKKKGPSSLVLRTLKPNHYDFIYIDGCHQAACTFLDAALSWDLLRVGGTLIFDDYVWRMSVPAAKRPKLAIDAFVESFLPFIDVLQTNNHSLILTKTKSSLDAMSASVFYQSLTKQATPDR